MKKFTRAVWQKINDAPVDRNGSDALPRDENQKKFNNPSSRGHHLNANKGPHPDLNQTYKLTPKNEEMSRQAAISVLYGPKHPTKDDIDNDKKETCLPSHSIYHKGNDGKNIEENERQYSRLRYKTQVLDKKLPLPPTPPHRVGGLKWQQNQMATAASMSLDPNDKIASHYTQASHSRLDRPMAKIAGLVGHRWKDQDKARKTLGMDTPPENPFDDYYALSYIEERALTRGQGRSLASART